MFSEKLGDYLDALNCTGKDLANITGLSPTTISRYRSGERSPRVDSEQFHQLVAGLASLATERGLTDLTEQVISAGLAPELTEKTTGQQKLADNLGTLISSLNINVSAMARFMNYDPSHLSRIRQGQRLPPIKGEFLDKACSFVVNRYSDPDSKAKMAALIGCDVAAIATDHAYYEALVHWLGSNAVEPSGDSTLDFLQKLDEFDLNEYISAIHFDSIKVPTAPFQLPMSKRYYGLKEMKQAELDFLKSVVLSHKPGKVITYSNMPMEDMVDDSFPQKWMYGLGAMLKKGARLSIIHDLDRPFSEMMLGLEAWIPLYMTGQVSPYYFKNPQGGLFRNLIYSADNVALSAECVAGQHARGMYYLTKNRREVAYYRDRMNDLLSKALPLMHIYRTENSAGYQTFLREAATQEGNRRRILSAPPLSTISPELLRRILERQGVPQAKQREIETHAKTQRERFARTLTHGQVEDSIPTMSEEEFAANPMLLQTTDMFLNDDVHYTYDDYLEHLALTQEYAATHEGYSVKLQPAPAFRNIQIRINEGSWVLVSKGKAPIIHFVIRHPRLCNAIENMVVPVRQQ